MRQAGIFFLMIVIFAVFECKNGNKSRHSEGDSHEYIHLNPGPTDEVFPREVLKLPGNLANNIRNTKELIEVFSLSQLVKLEVTDHSRVAQIDQAIWLNDSWIILDQIQALIFRFSKNGSFIQTIGHKGEGPGEFGRPIHLKKVLSDKLAVYDADRGQIMVYDNHGTHIFTTNQFSGNATVFPQYNFIFEKRDRLYIASYPSFNQDAPWHVILDYSKDQYSILWGFGQRFEPLVYDGNGRWAFSAFEKIEQNIWTGPPYGAHLEIFDLDGRFLRKVNTSARLDNLQYEDFENIDKKKARALRKKANIGHILQVGSIVIVRVKNSFDIFDINGNLLAGPLKRGKFHNAV